MMNFLARMAYYTSVGLDGSEFPVAGMRQKERLKRLKKRIGPKAFKEFRKMDTIRDPAAWVSFGKFPILGALILAATIYYGW